MNKWKVIEFLIFIGYYGLSVICGMTVFLVLSYASFVFFPTGSTNVFMHIGAAGLMFYTSVKVYLYFNRLYHDTKRGIKQMKLLKSKGLKSKNIKILSPKEDWIDDKKKKTM